MSRSARGMMFLLVLTIVWSVPAGAAMYSSNLGFSVDLPPGWQVLSNEEFRRFAGRLDADMGDAGTESFGNLMRQMEPLVRSGEVVYFRNPDLSGSIVSVMRGRWELPENRAEAGDTCRDMPAHLSRLAGGPVQVYACELRRVGNSNAFYTVSDAFISGNKTFQYQIDKGRGEVLVVTAQCRDQNCGPTSRQFERLVDSLRIG